MTGDGLFKKCGCGRDRWPKCPQHPWYYRQWGPQGRVRISLERELGYNPPTKADALKAVEPIATAIEAGTFLPAKQRKAAGLAPQSQAPAPTPAATTSTLTYGQLLDSFHARVIKKADISEGEKKRQRSMIDRLQGFDPGTGPLGTREADKVTEDLLEEFFEDIDEFAGSTWDKYVTLVTRVARWADRKEGIRNPLTGDSTLIVRRGNHQRHQRVRIVDQLIAAATTALDAFAGNRLAALILAAIETGARRGELLKLQWKHVDLRGGSILFVETKNGKTRRIGITAVLLPVLQFLQLDPRGTLFGPAAYVFGNEVGEQIKGVCKAWITCLLRAHGQMVGWTATGGYDKATKAALKVIDLHFHDLRHEAAWRWHEDGMALARIQAMLGHATLEQTTTYLGIDPHDLPAALEEYDQKRTTRPVAPAFRTKDRRLDPNWTLLEPKKGPAEGSHAPSKGGKPSIH